MNAEIIGVGTELLLGQIANTNAQKISQALAGIGVDVYYHTAVGDNPARMAGVIREAIRRSDAVIITGGLGPTPDDITREAVADALARPLRRDASLAGVVRGIFEGLGRPMPEANLRQADLPEGARAIPPVGTAPGFYVEDEEGLVVALPGVPWEMSAMLDDAVLPLLRARSGPGALVTHEVLVVGLGESHTEKLISDIVESQSNPTIAFLAGAGRVRVRISAKAPSEEDALARIEPVERAVRSRLGEAAVPWEGASLAGGLGAMLRARAATVAVAESLTGGLIGAELTEEPGSSEYFRGTIGCYSNESKRDVVGVDEAILAGSGPVGEPAAAALAEGAARLFAADLGLSATGVAGPGDQDGIAAGTIFVGATFRGHTDVRRVRGYGDRDNVRALAVTAALDLGRRVLAATG